MQFEVINCLLLAYIWITADSCKIFIEHPSAIKLLLSDNFRFLCVKFKWLKILSLTRYSSPLVSSSLLTFPNHFGSWIKISLKFPLNYEVLLCAEVRETTNTSTNEYLCIVLKEKQNLRWSTFRSPFCLSVNVKAMIIYLLSCISVSFRNKNISIL